MSAFLPFRDCSAPILFRSESFLSGRHVCPRYPKPWTSNHLESKERKKESRLCVEVMAVIHLYTECIVFIFSSFFNVCGALWSCGGRGAYMGCLSSL